MEVGLDPLIAPRDGAVEPDFGDRRRRVVLGDHRIDSHRVHRGDDHRVADWVKPERHRPLDLVVVPNVHVLVKHVCNLRDRHLGRPKHHGERLLGVTGALLPNLCVGDVAEPSRIGPNFEHVESGVLEGPE